MEQFNVDLSNCDREPIRIPGKIQSHGFLLAYEIASGQITFTSNNLHEYTGIQVQRALASTIQQFFQEQQALQFSVEQLRQLEEDIIVHHKTDGFVYVPGQGRVFNLIAHKSGDQMVLEFEPNDADLPSIKLNDVLGEIIAPLQDGLSLAKVLPLLAKHIKAIIGYDRVMVYKYWDDWHGEVVAEAKNEELEPYLGLHYPASDIPKQARELYMSNLVRLIANVDTEPAVLLSPIGLELPPLDLSNASLRAVSPMHIQYLKNMDVKASFSISLMSRGQLWGLIACHHYSPRFMDYESRQTCKLLAQLLSTTLNAKVEEEQITIANSYKEEADRIFESMYRSGDVPKSFLGNAPSILRMCNASGAALVFENKVYTTGQTPEPDQIKELAHWLSRNAPSRLYHTNALPKFYGKATNYSPIASGLLALELFKSNEEYLLWFKPELTQTVKWAGQPQKPIEVDATGETRLTPRQSFAVWFEEVKLTSAPWERAEILAVLRLREGILQVISQKANEMRKLNEKLKEAYDELETFSHTISHDLRTPISVIKNYSEILHDELEELPPEEIKTILVRIIKGADDMNALIKEVLAYSRLSNLDASDHEIINMDELLNDIAQQAQRATHGEVGLHIKVAPNISASKVLVQQIFMNLIDNAIKYTSKKVEPQIVVEGVVQGKEVVYQISDNGIGIDVTQGDRVFMLFKRMDNATAYDGSGIGLATVKRLVKKLGGRVWFESELNKGTVFFVTFPIIEK